MHSSRRSSVRFGAQSSFLRIRGVRALTLGVTFLSAVALPTSAAEAHGPYVVVRDDGTLSKTIKGSLEPSRFIMKAYEATGAERPDVISVWSAFTADQSDLSTLFFPAGNDVAGIGLDSVYGDDGTFYTEFAPTKAMLLHNNIYALPKRAEFQHAPVENFADYLFLLELSHLWGPALRIPVADGGTTSENALIGFRFHWSFWMDAGGSPAGGNRWKDNGQGTFTAITAKPSDLTYSMLDLYMMGLADPSEVPPFGILENAVSPANITDPFTSKALGAASFPYWDDTKVLTVTASRRTITIEDIITANGPRTPAQKDWSHRLTLGIVLMLPKGATDDDAVKAQAAMDPIAARLAPAFERATLGRGHLDVLTKATVDEVDAGIADDAGENAVAPSAPGDNGGCAAAGVAPSTAAVGAFSLVLGAAALARLRLRRRRR